MVGCDNQDVSIKVFYLGMKKQVSPYCYWNVYFLFSVSLSLRKQVCSYVNYIKAGLFLPQIR